MHPERPNILIFMTDDHGQWAAGCYGNRQLHTPTMDWLASTGAKMVNAFTPSPVCSPARASFHTGCIPSMHGIHDFLAEPGIGKDHPGLRGQPTLAQWLRRAGYRTGLSGKWHCSDAWIPQPGFDFWFSMSRGTQARFGEQWFCDNGDEVCLHGHQAPMVTDGALRFLREWCDAKGDGNGESPGEGDDREPFFLVVGYTDTHTPHSGSPERLVSRYRECGFDDIPDESIDDRYAAVRFKPRDDAAAEREERAQYYAAVETIDEQMGRIIDELDSRGELDHTLIVYTADHGHMNGHHGLHTKGNATIPQNLLEESIRVPCLLRWPGAIEAGATHEAMVDHCDLFALVLDAAGAEPGEKDREVVRSPGRSYLPLLCGQAMDRWRDAQFCEYGNARLIRTARYKLIERYAGPNGHFSDELYDLVDDPRERVNRIEDASLAVTIDGLRERLHDHFARFEDEARTGMRIGDQPLCNPVEPWRMDPATVG